MLLFNKLQSSLSTNGAVIFLKELRNKYFANEYFVCVALIDLRKVFNIVNHDILLAKLEHYGVNAQTVKRLRSSLKIEHNICI